MWVSTKMWISSIPKLSFFDPKITIFDITIFSYVTLNICNYTFVVSISYKYLVILLFNDTRMVIHRRYGNKYRGYKYYHSGTKLHDYFPHEWKVIFLPSSVKGLKEKLLVLMGEYKAGNTKKGWNTNYK